VQSKEGVTIRLPVPANATVFQTNLIIYAKEEEAMRGIRQILVMTDPCGCY
jgi:hypothetical protein